MSDTLEIREQLLARCPASFGHLFRERVAETPNAIAFRFPADLEAEQTDWQSLTYAESSVLVDELAAGLLSLGLELEQRVALASSTRIEWVLGDLGVMCAGGAVTTVYPNTNADEVHYIVTHCEAVMMIAENWSQVDKIAGFDDYQLRHVILIDDDRPADADVPFELHTWDELRELGRAYLAESPACLDDVLSQLSLESLATIIYTSGTTGRPKGVELPHRCWVYEAVAVDHVQLGGLSDDIYLWLPLAHVFGKDLLGLIFRIGGTAVVDGRVPKIVDGLGETKPTIMIGVPRIFEKVRATVMTSTAGRFTGRIARWAFAVGRETAPYRLADQPLPRALEWKYRLADHLVFRKLRDKMGGRSRFFISGSAKLDARVQRWFYSAGITIIEGYGSTETTAIAHVDHPDSFHPGTVGRPLPGIEVKIADDGEVLFRGPSIMDRYHNDPERTAEVLDEDGWFHTGDVGTLDEDGYLTIRDRKKDLFKTSGGKYIAPQKIEGTIVANIPYVSQAVVIGEGRKYVSALIELDHDMLMRWGERHGHPDASYAELSQRPEIYASIERLMAKANEHLERWETVKKFAILDAPLADNEGMTTASMKVRRHQVSEHYADLIDGLYPSEDNVDD